MSFEISSFRKIAAETLGTMGPAAIMATEALKKAVTNRDSEFAECAQSALKKIEARASN
jgi:hypothetical protein